MAINIYIEHLLLENLPLTGDQSGVVQAAIEVELASLLGENADLFTGSRLSAVPQINAANLQLTGNPDPTELGRQIARAIYRGLQQ